MAKRLHTITAQVKAAFVRSLSDCGNVRAAAQQVGTVREYSDTLLIFLLKGWKPEKYKDRREVFHRGTVELLHKLEQVSAMTPDELQTFLAEVEAHMQQRSGRDAI